MKTWIDAPDWYALFTPSIPVAEVIVRGTAFYLGLFVLLRVLLKRNTGVVGVADLLVVVLIADAAQNGMAGDYKSIVDGLLLVLVIVCWTVLLDWASYRFPAFRYLVEPKPLPLIRDGQLLHANMRREFITRAELMSQLREEGVERVEDVTLACMEGTGRISVLKREPEKSGRASSKRSPPDS
jgi:uncharacterized membrane protein YcaP (DUF421 family)